MLPRRLWIPIIVSFLVLITFKPEFILPGGFLLLVLVIITSNMSGLRRLEALLTGIFIYGYIVVVALVYPDTYFWPWQRPFFRTVVLPLCISVLRPVGNVVLWDAARQGMLTIKNCDDDQQAFHIESIYVDGTLARVILDGTLARDALGVASHGIVRLGDGPPGSSMIDWLLRNIIFQLNEYHKPLQHPLVSCTDSNCFLKRGKRKLHLDVSSSFDLAVPLYGLIGSGVYEMHLTVVDRWHEPVLCLYAQLHIPVGPNGEQFHRVIGLMGGTSSTHARPFFLLVCVCVFACLRAKAPFNVFSG